MMIHIINLSGHHTKSMEANKGKDNNQDIYFNLLAAHTGVNSSLASVDFCHLLITFANSLDPDQDRQSVGPDLDPNCLTL